MRCSNNMNGLINIQKISLILHLSHWGRVTHTCVSILTIIGLDNGLSPERRQAIIWTNAEILLIGTLGTNFSEIISEIHIFLIQENVFENVVRERVANLSRLQCVIHQIAPLSLPRPIHNESGHRNHTSWYVWSTVSQTNGKWDIGTAILYGGCPPRSICI